MRLACAADFQELADALPAAQEAALERFAEIMTQLRSSGHSDAVAALLAQQVLRGEALPPRPSIRFARIYGD